jgi:D-alanyl-D-alanine carboxypeptidase
MSLFSVNARRSLSAVAGGLALSGGLAFGAHAQEKYAAFVVNAETDEVLYESFGTEARYPASLTKVMTLYMVFDALKSGELTLDERLPVSANAAAQPRSNLALKKGETIRVSDAIKALITKSANDVAVVVAERLGGTEERFAALMTVRARLMGLTDTRFYNASGLPDDRQVTTAQDMARLAEAILEDHPEYYGYFSLTEFTWAGVTHKTHNDLLKTGDGVDGMKTGYTRASGYNLMTSVKRDGEPRLIVIMLGGASAKARNTHVSDLITTAYTAIAAPAWQTASRTRFPAFERINYTDTAMQLSFNDVLAEAENGEGN